MDSMKCWDCLLKHIAAAVSYAKEVMSGHGRGNELDHRVDFLGEIVNAEQHAEMLDAVLMHQISILRKTLQNTKVSIDFQMIDDLRNLYIKVENQQQVEEDKLNFNKPQQQPKPDTNVISKSASGTPFVSMVNDATLPLQYQDPLDVVYEKASNLEYFRFSYNSLKRFLQPRGNVYILKDELGLDKHPEFSDVKVVNTTLFEFCKLPELTRNFLYMKENMAWINPEDSRKAAPMFSIIYNNEMTRTKQELRRTHVEDRTRVYDNLKPQPIDKNNYAVVMEKIGDTTHPMAHYYTLTTIPYNELPLSSRLVTIERPVCCSTRGKLRTSTWATWTNKDNFESMKDFLTKERGLVLLPEIPANSETSASSQSSMAPALIPSSAAPASSQSSSLVPALPKPIIPAKPVPEPVPNPLISSTSSQEKK